MQQDHAVMDEVMKRLREIQSGGAGPAVEDDLPKLKQE